MKKLHGLKKGDSKSFKNSKELLEWCESHRLTNGEFALQCGRGEKGEGYRIVKA